ncbi:gluconokinase [Stackebrandtia endophytica]|uniref:gluconokinase n=1 Tax=Stackebrandtia endophytica TaxID=1496996 RepID=UPI001476EAEA|nr:gluconokinase [Stackebrandtia endophytica]
MNDTAVIITGVSGSGKTTIGKGLAERLGWPYADADDFHPPHNVHKLTHGHPLTDEDRQPWLTAMGDWLDARHAADESVVLSCSGLKRRYRDQLHDGRPQVHIVHLHGTVDLIAERLRHRHGHFMKAHMLEGQFSDLEDPQADEDILTVNVDQTPEAIVSEIVSGLKLAESA